MAKFLAAQGHKVDVITAHPYYPEWRLRQGWPRLKYVKDAPDPKFERLNVIHCPLYVPRNPTGFRRILHHASFALTAFIPAVANSFSKGRSNVVIVIAPSLLSAVSACIAARIAGSKTWLHIQAFEVEAAISTGLLKKRGRITQLALAFEHEPALAPRIRRVILETMPLAAQMRLIHRSAALIAVHGQAMT